MNRAQAVYSTVEQDDGALIARYGHLIDRVARRLAMRAGSMQLADELWSSGALGLLEAARRFDKERAIKFETFAEHRIRGAMLDELRNLDHLPRRLRAQTDQVHKARAKLAKSLGREALPEELAAEVGVSLEELGGLEQLTQPHVQIGPELRLVSADQSAEERVEQRERLSQLTGAVSGLSERMQTLLSLYYVEELTYREIARMLEVSEARVCQLHAEAIALLRGLL